MSTAQDAGEIKPTGEQMAVTDTRGEVGLAAAGLGAEVLAGMLARSLSEGYGEREIGSVRAKLLARRLDTQLLCVYCLAVTSGLVRYRRPLPVYAGLATLLASGLVSRKRPR